MLSVVSRAGGEARSGPCLGWDKQPTTCALMVPARMALGWHCSPLTHGRAPALEAVPGCGCQEHAFLAFLLSLAEGCRGPRRAGPGWMRGSRVISGQTAVVGGDARGPKAGGDHVATLPRGDLVIYESTEVLKLFFCLFTEGTTYVTVVHPDAVAVVPGPALHDVVGVVRLRHLVVGIDDNLEQVVSRRHVSDVDPLAVNVMTVHVPAAHGDALLTKVGALVTLLDVSFTFCVLQAEASFVPSATLVPLRFSKS